MKLKETAVPSQHLPVSKCAADRSGSVNSRKQRADKREVKKKEINEIEENMRKFTPEADNEVTIENDEVMDEDMEEETEEKSCDRAVNCTILTDSSTRWSISHFENNAGAVHFYTGFDNYDHFMLVFNLLGQAAYDLNYKCSLIPPCDQFFLTMMKLRLNRADIELSFLFNVSTSTISALFNTWINFMYFQFKEIDIWPSRDVINEHMPDGFKKFFPRTRVVLDATETPIAKPSDIKAQSATFSTYKNKNTLKTMVGISPRGAVTHVSECYGGCASDRQIIERSSLMAPGTFSPKDSIMADRGIMVQDLFASKDVFVNTPHMLKGKSQLEPQEVVYDRRIASKRIHVERVIGYTKTFKILKSDLSATQVNNGSRILFVCFFLTNLRKSIVNNKA